MNRQVRRRLRIIPIRDDFIALDLLSMDAGYRPGAPARVKGMAGLKRWRRWRKRARTGGEAGAIAILPAIARKLRRRGQDAGRPH